MKAKITRGSGFRGALDYALGEKKEAEIVGGTMIGQTPRELSAEFAPARGERPGVKKPVWHCSLSLPAGENLTAEKWDTITSEFMEKMGFDDSHDFVAIRHKDTEYDHVHIVANRIGRDGGLWYGQFELLTSIKATQELEKDHDLTLTPGLESGADRGPTKGEVAEMQRTGLMSSRLALQEIVGRAKEGNPHISEFMQRIEDEGGIAVPSLRKEGELRGFSFAYEGRHFTGKQLGKAYTGKVLREELRYEHTQEFEEIAQLRNRATEIANDLGNGGTAHTGRLLKQLQQADERSERAERERDQRPELAREAFREAFDRYTAGTEGSPRYRDIGLGGREALQNENTYFVSSDGLHVRRISDELQPSTGNARNSATGYPEGYVADHTGFDRAGAAKAAEERKANVTKREPTREEKAQIVRDARNLTSREMKEIYDLDDIHPNYKKSMIEDMPKSLSDQEKETIYDQSLQMQKKEKERDNDFGMGM